MRDLFLRPIQLVVAALVVLTIAALATLGWLSWRSLKRLESVEAGVDRIYAIQEAGLRMQERALADVSGAQRLDAAALRASGAELEELMVPRWAFDGRTVAKLRAARERLSDATVQPLAAMVDATLWTREALHDETRAELGLLHELRTQAQVETALTGAALAALPLALGVVAWLLRKRLFGPIDNLKDLLTGLAAGRFEPVPVRDVDPLLAPLFDHYNQMVTRLESLEHAHREHEANLENNVRNATHTLLEQSRSLARAERLAAVGELAATVAHELRNPLAGVQMTLANLRREVPGSGERLDLVNRELQRVNRLLSELLSSSRHDPEPARSVRLATVVSELLELTRYQVPRHIALEHAVAAELECWAPPDALKQALLNLVLNAVEAVGAVQGKVSVGASGVDGAVVLEVRDDGPGFPAALLEGGVRPFASARESGTGLGLAMVQRFAREMHGDLVLANLSPRGALAQLRIPIAHD